MNPSDRAVGTAAGAPHDALAALIESVRVILDLGGWVTVILLVLSVVALAVVIAKLAQFVWRGVGRHKRSEAALDAWLGGRREAAYASLARLRSPLAVVLAHAMRGTERARNDVALLREDIERVSIGELERLRSHLRVLETIGQIAPLLGLFGTVIGMIEAFRQMQAVGSSVDPSVLAGGIWVALMTTAVGLAVAIPASLFATWFDGRVERERVALEMLLTAFFTGRITDERAPVPVRDVQANAIAHEA